MRRRRHHALVAHLIVLLCAPQLASAFTFESQLSDGCHERITLDALAIAGWPGGLTPPPPSALDERALADLLFDLPGRSQDGWSMALLLGVRDNDLRGRAPSDLAGLSEVHNDPRGQAAHCLRAPEDDGPAGDVSALAACRAFILAETEAALGPEDALDLEALEELDVTLAFSGRVMLPARRFGVHAGRALHALQDGFSHTFRDDDLSRVRHVLNFVDAARSHDYRPARDGSEHRADLDLCEHTSHRQALRAEAATRATVDYLRALASSEGGRSGRLTRAMAVVDRHLALEPGCVADNDYCGGEPPTQACGCTAVEGPAPRGPLPLGIVLILGWVVRRRRCSAPLPLRVAVVLPLLAAVVLPQYAHAAPVVTATSSAALTKPDSETTGHVSLQLALSGALDSPAIAGAGAIRWQFADDVTIGADVEYNPWISFDAARFAPGTLNAYGTVVYRWWSIGDVDLRLTAHAGISVLLFDLVNATAGSFGPYLGLSLLGVSFRVSDAFTLILDPADLSLPIPSVSGVPFLYQQYRFTVAFAWNP